MNEHYRRAVGDVADRPLYRLFMNSHRRNERSRSSMFWKNLISPFSKTCVFAKENSERRFEPNVEGIHCGKASSESLLC